MKNPGAHELSLRVTRPVLELEIDRRLGYMPPSETRFLADAMLGKLAKWLRVMGFDTHYQPVYEDETIKKLVNEGRLLLSRHYTLVEMHPHSLLILSDKIPLQLEEIRARGYLTGDIEKRWFTRCLSCNTPLEEASFGDASKNIPDYILHQNIKELHFCRSCRHYFWPGSHRYRMVNQLKQWGVVD
jgi:uncharacterized protein with PIN domain